MKKSFYILGLSLLLAGCYYDKEQDLYPSVTACDTSAVTYSGKVLSIIQSNCYSCHGSGNTLGDVNLDGHTNLKVFADNGKLSGAINHRTGFSQMPQGGSKLSDCDIQAIEKWISDGSPNN
jgi:mono/diheme cytochrome c family protein